MALTATRRTTRAALALLLVLAVAAGFDGWRLSRHVRLNAAIAAGRVPADADPRMPEVAFAQAFALAASGATDDAAKRYRALQGDALLGQTARFNGANGLLRQAVLLRAGEQPGQAIPLIELAKESYREILRADPDHWPARYNLERAQRLLPDPEPGDADVPDAAKNAERAATTMRGYSPGLP